MITLRTILMILAVVLFVCAGFDIKASRVNLGWLGLAALAIAFCLRT